MSQTERAQPESFRARSINASLTVKDLQTSLVWWRDVMGCTVDQIYEFEGQVRSVAFKVGDVRFLINQDDGKRGWDRQKGEGVSFMFTTTQDVDRVAARIKAAGGTLVTEPADMPWGSRAFRIVDPDGYRFTIASERTPVSRS